MKQLKSFKQAKHERHQASLKRVRTRHPTSWCVQQRNLTPLDWAVLLLCAQLVYIKNEYQLAGCIFICNVAENVLVSPKGQKKSLREI